MALLTSRPQHPLSWRKLTATVGMLWLAPVTLGLVGLFIFATISKVSDDFESADALLALWFYSYALLLSPLFSWIGWLLALPPVALALKRGWFGWGAAMMIGAAAGALAGAVADTELALPFGILALLALRAALGRVMPI